MKQKIDWKTHEDPFEASHNDSSKSTVSFGDIYTDSPVLIGNLGGSELIRIETVENHFYMIEKTGVGNIVIWTYFPKYSTMIMSKQYDLFGPFSTISIGKCKSL